MCDQTLENSSRFGKRSKCPATRGDSQEQPDGKQQPLEAVVTLLDTGGIHGELAQKILGWVECTMQEPEDCQ